MARRSEIASVYAAGVVQGVALVTFPAASAIFTSPNDYGLSSTAYGGLFLPQAITAIGAALAGAGLRNGLGTKRIYLLGLLANLLAMTLLVISQFTMHNHAVAYRILLAATTFMGIGFGFAVPALNTLAAQFSPQKVDRAILALNALLGLGTALAPVFVAVFVGIGIWWGLPVLVGSLLLGLLLASVRQPLGEGKKVVIGVGKPPHFPARFWVFAAFALLYGICETMNGNWAALYLQEQFQAGSSTSALALTVFWTLVTAGRILFAALEKWLPATWVFRALPVVVGAALVASACVPKTKPTLAILTFALAGLGCSALLPLTISFGQKELTTLPASVAGGLIAFYQIGYGLAAFGVGPLQAHAGLELKTIFGGASLVALALVVLAFVVVRKSSPSIQPNIQPTTT